MQNIIRRERNFWEKNSHTIKKKKKGFWMWGRFCENSKNAFEVHKLKY